MQFSFSSASSSVFPDVSELWLDYVEDEVYSADDERKIFLLRCSIFCCIRVAKSQIKIYHTSISTFIKTFYGCIICMQYRGKRPKKHQVNHKQYRESRGAVRFINVSSIFQLNSFVEHVRGGPKKRQRDARTVRM